MKRTMAAKLSAAALFAASALCLTACSNPVSAVTSAISSPTVEEALASQLASSSSSVSAGSLLEDGTLTVGLSRSASTPMVITGSDGSYDGYDVDMAYALGSQLGLKVKLVSVSGASSIGTECDVLMGAESIRSSDYTVAGSYAEDAIAFFYKGGEKVSEKGDLLGKTVGVQDGSTSSQLLKRSDIECTSEAFTNLNDAFDALEQGTVDYVLCNANSGAYLAGFYDGIACAGTIETPTALGVGVASANSELQNAVKEAVDAISSNGVGDILRAKWLAGMSPLTESSTIANVSISAGTVEGTSDTAEATNGSSGVQDGSTAGANAATIEG